MRATACFLVAALLAAGPALAREIAGHVTLRERLALPGDTMVRIEATAADGRRVSVEMAPGASQPPYGFVLRVPEDEVTLTATIAAEGRVWAIDPLRMAAGEDVDTGFLLAFDQEPAGKASLLACGTALVALDLGAREATISRGRDAVRLVFQGEGQGATFSDGADYETRIESTADQIRVTWEGEALPPCAPFANPAETAMTFRGNEPGWVLALGPDGARLTGEDGKDRQSAALPFYRTGDVLRLVPPGLPDIDLTPGLCFDTMTGMPYPISANLEEEDVTLTGCGGEPATLLDGRWSVTEVDGAPVPAGVEIGLSTADGKLSGTGGCNRLIGLFTPGQDGLRFGPIGSTRMACAPSVMAVEAALLAALAAADRFSIDDDGALLLIGGDRTRLRATR